LILLFDSVAVDRMADYGIANIITGLNKRSELGIKNYEIAILIAIVINGDPADSTEIDFEIDVVEILIIFIFIRNVDICQIN
jgi:hypothetical protein